MDCIFNLFNFCAIVCVIGLCFNFLFDLSSTLHPRLDHVAIFLIHSTMCHTTTIKELARLCSVSISTVSRALNDHPSIGIQTKERIKKLARELDYEPNVAAIQFKKGRKMTVGVIVPELSETFFSLPLAV